MAITRIYVDREIINNNKTLRLSKEGRTPPITIETDGNKENVNCVQILGPSKVCYSPDSPLPCGATVWVETDSAVEVLS